MSHLCSHCQSTCLGYRPSELGPSLDLDRLLAINDPPAASQEEGFRSKCIDGVQRIAELEIIIMELQRTLGSAMVERDAHAREVERYRLVLNPVRRLPADILREIFLCACARSTKNPSYFYQIPPTFLAAVCRSWHHAAVTFPQLWRHCKFVVPSNGVASNGDDGAYLSSGLSFFRSATCPLWVDLHLQNLTYSNPAYPLLLSISGRIQRIRISTRDPRPLESSEFRHFLRGMNTTLVQMDLSIPANRAPATSPISLPQTVRHLVITPNAAFCSPDVDLNWSHLVNLVLRARDLYRGPASIRSTLIILAKVPNLHRLTFSDDQCATGHGAGGDELPDPDGLITIPHLTDLVIENCRSAIGHVVVHLATPCVQRVTHMERLPINKGRLRIAPNCTLRHLTSQIGGEDGMRVYLTRHAKLLRELSLLGVHDALTVTGLHSFLEPMDALRVLVLDISSVSAFGMQSSEPVADAILEILESRRILPGTSDSDSGAASGVELESFTLHAPLKEVFDFTDAQYECIEALRASGLLFYICRYAKNDPRNY